MLPVQISLFLGLFSSLALAATIPNTLASTPSGNGTATGGCGGDCAAVVTGAGCASGDNACFCAMDFKATSQFFKCLLDECPADDAEFALVLLSAGCGEILANSTSASHSGSPAPTASATNNASVSAIPTVAPAAAFTLPSCGSGCINATSVPDCASSLDPGCVCNSSTFNGTDVGSGTVMKCFFDSCDEAGAANSMNSLMVNCGQLLPVSQWPYPFKNFAAANTTTSASGAASATGTSPASSPSHSNGAGVLGFPSLLTFVAALMGTLLL